MQNQSNSNIDSFGVIHTKPFHQAEVSQRSLPSTQSFTEKNLIPSSSQEIRVNTVTTIQKQYTIPKSLICQIHNIVQDLGCLRCQEKICSHCAIFGVHKGHKVIPEIEMKNKNKNGLEQMIQINHKIQCTKEDFIRKMEENFQNIICDQIYHYQNTFKQATCHKFQEFYKLLEYSEQKCYDEIEKFFLQVEEKFKKFKNHTFKETHEKIINWNQMIYKNNLFILCIRVEQTRQECDNLEKSNQVCFDLFLNLEKLLISGNELEIEYNNLLQFPVKLIGNYLDNIQFSFSDSIQSNIQNCMSLQFLHNESDIIRKSIENLTFENQKEILSNAHLFKLTPQEIKSILGTSNQTPSQIYFQSNEALNLKQCQTGGHLTSRRTSNAYDSTRQNSKGQKIKSKQKESDAKADISLENVDTVVAELSSYRQKTIVPQLKESSLNKDKVLQQHFDHQQDFMRNSNMFNSVKLNKDSDRQNNNYLFTDSDLIYPNSFNNIGNDNHKKGRFSTHENCKFDALLEKQIHSNLMKQRELSKQRQQEKSQQKSRELSKSREITKSKELKQTSDFRRSQQYTGNSLIPDKERIYQSLIQTPQTTSRNKSPYRITDEGINNGNYHNYEIKSARTHYTCNTENSQGDGGYYLKKSLTPQRNNNQLNKTSESQMMSKSQATTSGFQNQDLNKTLPSRENQDDGYMTSSSAYVSNQSSNIKQSNRNQQSIMNSSLKYFKSPTKNTNGKPNEERTSPFSSRKVSQSQYKKKSEKLQKVIQKLRLNEYIDQIELVSEDINDQECEELGTELAQTRQKIESIKLVKNKIGDNGLKAILYGLQKSSQKLHTLNLTSNQCTESCFDEILKYLQKNSDLKNIYLINNNIQIYKNKEKLKSIQQYCNIHI